MNPEKKRRVSETGKVQFQRLSEFMNWANINCPSISTILWVGLTLRLTSAFVIHFFALKKGTICLFGDSPIYWMYAKTLAEASTYVVNQWDDPHYALRTPGYPLWLAGWIVIASEWVLPIRIGQALLNSLSIWWLYLLAKKVGCSEFSARWATVFLALDPFQIVNSSLILTESIFTPLLVYFVLMWVRILDMIRSDNFTTRTLNLRLIALGGFQSYLSLVRPAWLFFVIVPLATIYFAAKKRGKPLHKSTFCSLFIIGWSIVNAPWALRNELRIGRMAIGGTWGGASLYDGVRPGATGASQMDFVQYPEYRALPETVQDDLWKSLSYKEILNNPVRMLTLAWSKQKRFWAAWPSDSAKVSWPIKVACAGIVWPVWIMMLNGIYKNRHNYLAILTLSPLIYTSLLHLLFVGSSRYRIAVIVPAMILAGEGMMRYCLNKRIITDLGETNLFP